MLNRETEKPRCINRIKPGLVLLLVSERNERVTPSATSFLDSTLRRNLGVQPYTASVACGDWASVSIP